MNVTNVMVITTAEEMTDNGFYLLEYSVSNGALIRAQATVMDRASAKSAHPQVIGTIYLEQNTVSCNLSEDHALAPFFTDFNQILSTIREGLATHNTPTQQI